jgi:putative aldouronate transport system permease protein
MDQDYYRKSIGSRIFDFINIILMLMVIFIMVYPFINQLAVSFNDSTDAVKGGIYFFPRKFSTSAYKYIFEDVKLLKVTIMSVLRVIVGTITCVFCTSLLAYVITIKWFSGRRFMRKLFVFTMYFGGGLIPFYLLMVRLHMTNSFNVYWIPGLLAPYYMLLIGAYMQDIPEAIFESARIDGASELTVFFKIAMPMATPVIAAVCIFVAVGHWNSWFDCMIYNPSGQFDTLQVYLKRLLLEVEAITGIRDQQLLHSKYSELSPVTVRAAATVVVTAPIIIIYPFFQNFFIHGMRVGAVKE